MTEAIMTETTENSPPWHVLGAGAIGCLFAAYLTRAGEKVSLLLSSHEKLERLQQVGGIHYERNGKVECLRPQAEVARLGTSAVERILVCTKSFDTLAALQNIAHRLNNGSRIVLLQNGMGQQESVKKHFPQCQLFCGSTTEGVWLRDHFKLVHAGLGSTLIGAWEAGVTSIPHDFLRIVRYLPAKIAWSDNIASHLWRKLAINACINPLTAIKQCRNGELLEDPDAKHQLETLCAEIETLYHALRLPANSRPLLQEVYAVAEATAENFSSMYQDISLGRRSEIEFINGFLCAQAKKLNINLPAHQALLQSVRGMETRPTPGVPGP